MESHEACCCVVAVNKDYPASGSKGQTINLNTNDHPISDGVVIFHAGTQLMENQLVTAGGRILAVTALSSDIHSAATRIYDYLPNIHFKDMDYRKDIGAKLVGAKNRN